MKKVIQIVLVLVILGLGFWLAWSIRKPIAFKKDVTEREVEVIRKAKEIRAAEQAYKSVHGVYTPNFDTLIHFILNDSLTFVRSVGSADDSVAVAAGLVYQEEFRIPVIDTVFSPAKLTPQDVRNLPIIPHSENHKFYLESGFVTTESGVVVPVFELRASYNDYLGGLDRQLIDNLIDEDVNTYGKYPGVKVGDLFTATNDAINRTE